jgi:hypothetical protein
MDVPARSVLLTRHFFDRIDRINKVGMHRPESRSPGSRTGSLRRHDSVACNPAYHMTDEPVMLEETSALVLRSGVTGVVEGFGMVDSLRKPTQSEEWHCGQQE